LCNNCVNRIKFDIEQRLRIIRDSNEIVRKSKNIETIISRSNLAIDHLNELSEFDKYELVETNFASFAEAFSMMKEELILNRLKVNYETIKEKLLTLSTTNAKVNQLNKLKVEVQKYYPLIKNYEGDVNHFLHVIEKEISKVKNDELLDKARKNEFKGNKKKALDYYYEALYSLKTDKIDDQEQLNQIYDIQRKITDLGGEVRNI